MKISKRLKIIFSVTLILFVLSAVLTFAAPGDSNDPLVTLSYITETLIPDINARIDQKIDAAMEDFVPSSGNSSASSGDSFVLVNVKKNQRIIGDEGTEFVVRSGSGVIVATANGGIADLTVGADLPNETEVPLNHHLLVPRSDSRGIRFTTNSIVLIRGSYSVKSK